MNRFHQLLLCASAATFSWLAMQAVHELGHVLHAWLSGGTVTAVVLYPLEISRTDVVPDPHPQFVAWGGPLWGCLIPLVIYFASRWRKWSRTWLFAFFSGFCLIANGGYLLGGSLYPVGDAERLLSTGAPHIALAAFGVATLGGGLLLWNGQGKLFGLGKEARPIDRPAARFLAVLTAIVVIAELLLHHAER